jgi:poly-gamma-glutamate capsule biosynthesis protein CapA/YwtB (metallophosphatase superfamily)
VIRRTASVLACAALLVAACSGAPPRSEAVVLLGGDVHGHSPVAEVLAAGGDPFVAVRPLLAEADVVAVNLETPVGSGGEPADKAIHFRADPRLLERLVRAGVDVVNLANNHAMDYGADLLAQTVAAAEEAGLAVVGVGPDEDGAFAPAVLEAAGRRVAVLGMTDVVPDGWAAGEGWGVASALDHERAVRAVTDARALADHVVVTVHWGLEYRECPSVVQTELARRLLEAGASVVAGHHPHVLQGVMERDGGAVAFSVGNLAFRARSAETREAGLLRAALHPDGTVEHELLPVVLDLDGRPRPANAEAAARIAEVVRVRSPGGGTCPAAVWDGLPGRRAP